MIKLSIKNLKFRFRLVAQISFICLLSSKAAQVSAQAGWTQIGATKLSTFDVKDGSLRNGKTKGGDAFVSIIVRMTSKDDDRIDVSERYVKTSDCANERGALVTLDLEGKFQFKNDFVFGLGTVASSIAEYVCNSANQQSGLSNLRAAASSSSKARQAVRNFNDQMKKGGLSQTKIYSQQCYQTAKDKLDCIYFDTAASIVDRGMAEELGMPRDEYYDSEKYLERAGKILVKDRRSMQEANDFLSQIYGETKAALTR